MASCLLSFVILIVVIFAAVYLYRRYWKCNCVEAHEKGGGNYSWLQNEFGTVKKIEFEEPVGSGNWRDYEQLHKNKQGQSVTWWFEHCMAVSHEPAKLKKAHMDAFVNPQSKFANLKFTFDNGKTYYSDKHPDIFSRFYDLEAEFFTCKNNY